MRRIAKSELRDAPRRLAEQNQPLAEQLEAHRAYAKALEQAERDMVSIVGQAARTVIAAELTQTPEQIEHSVARALHSVKSARRLTIQLNRADLAFLPSVEVLRARLELIGSLDLVATDELGRGDCVVLSELGDIDARIETSIERLQALLSRQVEP